MSRAVHPRDRRVPAGLAVLAFLIALWQRPGDVIADTKVHLHQEPGRFLADVGSVWSPTGDLGHVWAGQYAGYGFPMAPWFAVGDELGAPEWIVHRLWLGTLLALAAWGTVRLLDALLDAPRGAPHVAAGLLVVLNPYVAVYAGRTSIALLAYAALPWVLLCVHRGLRDPGGWWWPAALALVLTCTGGGVNAAVTAWMLLAPALLVLHAVVSRAVGWRSVASFGGRAVGLGVVTNLWWLVPLSVHARYGLDFLPFTEQPGTIWQTTSLSESLRGMGFWTSYIGVGYGGELRPFAAHGPSLLFNLGVVVAGLLVPAVAVGLGARVKTAGFFVGLVVVGAVVMAAGFPEGSPLRRALTFTYNEVQPVQVLRTSYKAGPLVVLGLAGLVAAGLATVAAGRRRTAAVVLLGGLFAVAAWPLTSGRAPDRQLAFEVPSWWTDAARDLDGAGNETRALVLPGQLFGAYDWGQTIDPIGPVLTSHPIATRSIVPYADRRAVELQWAVDDLVTQERALPGQLAPLLDVLGVGEVLLAADGDRGRAGQVGEAEAAAVLGGQDGLRPMRRYGPVALEPFAPDRVAAPVGLPRIERFDTRTGGLLRVVGRSGETVVDGGAAGLTGLAAFGVLAPDRPLRYAPDLGAEGVRRAAAAGARFVIADGNRRQAFVASRIRGNRGRVLSAGEDVSQDGTMLDPFTARDPRTQTVSVLPASSPVVSVRAPASPQVTQFPENRPTAALDGDPRTAWLADRFLERPRHRLTVRFRAPRDVARVVLTPASDARTEVRAVRVAGRRFAVRRGRNVLELGLRGVSELTVAMAEVDGARRASSGAGGIAELELPGVAPLAEALRPPTGVEAALRATDVSRSAVEYLLSRVTADAPARQGARIGAPGGGQLRDARDPEGTLRRVIRPPVARRWTARAWVRPSPRVGDEVLDRLAGVRGGSARGSARFEGRPGNRASSAWDGSLRRGWLGAWIGGRTTFVERTLRRTTTVRELRLERYPARVRRPTRVAVSLDGVSSGPVDVAADGRVVLPRALRGRTLRIDVLRARFDPGTPERLERRRAVGIAEVLVAGVPPLRVARGGEFTGGCGAAAFAVAGVTYGLEVAGLRSAFDAGEPLPATGCGPPARFGGGGEVLVADAPGRPLRVDHLRLAGAAERPPPTLSAASGRVLDAGDPGNGARENARVEVDRPSWIVLGESSSRGWRATCDGRSLGAPRPMQGYANGWPIDAPGCRDLDLTFAPGAATTPAAVLSLLACLLMLTALLRRATGGQTPGSTNAAIQAEKTLTGTLGSKWGLTPGRSAAVVGLAATPVLGFVFALRAGVVLGPLVAFVLWKDVSARTLRLLAAGLLGVVVPALYALDPARDRGGFSTTYAVDQIAAHWVAVGALVLLALSTATGRGASRAG